MKIRNKKNINKFFVRLGNFWILGVMVIALLAAGTVLGWKILDKTHPDKNLELELALEQLKTGQGGGQVVLPTATPKQEAENPQREYYRGAKGGIYYLTPSGRKCYIDREYGEKMLTLQEQRKLIETMFPTQKVAGK